MATEIAAERDELALERLAAVTGAREAVQEIAALAALLASSPDDPRGTEPGVVAHTARVIGRLAAFAEDQLYEAGSEPEIAAARPLARSRKALRQGVEDARRCLGG